MSVPQENWVHDEARRSGAFRTSLTAVPELRKGSLDSRRDGGKDTSAHVWPIEIFGPDSRLAHQNDPRGKTKREEHPNKAQFHKATTRDEGMEDEK